MSRIRKPVLIAAVLAAALAAPSSRARAQTYLDLTDDAIASIIGMHNAPGTSRFSGEALIASGTELRGDAAILHGPLLLEGSIVGRVLVVNGSAILEPGARVSGDLIVVGGDIEGADEAIVDGELIVYREALAYRRVGELIFAEEPEPIAGVRAGREFGFGRTSFSVAMRGAYNRVEGMPIAFGPRLAFGRSNPTVLDAALIYRTAGGFTLEERQLGHVVRLEQFIGGHGRFRLGATLHSEVLPIEASGLSDTESSLATFILHRDYRDHYERDGWSAYLHWRNERRALDATLTYRDETHRTREAQSPWTLIDNGEPFRRQPLVADGSLRTVVLAIDHDSRNDVRDPSSGWWVRLASEQGVGGSAAVQASPDGAGGATADPWPADERFSALTLDARRYLRLGPLTRVSLRAWAAGAVDGGPLPPQRQHTLGGEGTMPGFELFQFDCGARDAAISLGGAEPMFSHYGCDRVVLGQASLERTLPFIQPLGRSLGLDFDFGHEPSLALFMDAGRAWIEDGARQGRLGGRSSFSFDAGLGLRLGRIGFYWAVPLTDEGGGANFFVRIGPRI
ncbi:MAG TPA: BamA/TamA family outer membrane protein [Longimicrobiales bacterium]|nr:BamA/TamA family outer membrane protein [Longimicrobiales bacterium]